MTVQARQNVDTRPFVLETMNAKREDDATILQDAGRVIPLAPYTLMAKIASSQKWVPLTDVTPTLTGGNMVCGAIGGTLADFAALSDAEFAISVDGTLINVTGLDFTGIDTVEDRAGYMTCGALGGTLPEFAAVSDGQFGITVDGTLINITVDLSGLDAEDDIPGYFTCGANGTNLAGWQAVTDGSVAVTVNGVVVTLTGLDFSTAATLNDIADTINYAAAGRFTVIYDGKADIYRFVSNTTGETSTVSAIATGGVGTNIAAAGFLNAPGGAATAGTGGEGTAQTIPDIINAAALGRFFCYFSGDAMVFVSRSTGELSTVTVLTAGAGGTDISGAGFLNGLTGTGTAVAGVGGEGLMENIAEIINGAALGRFFCAFDGDAFTFASPLFGTDSVVTVLTAVVGGVGTDISGAAYLNGLTGTGTATAGTGGTGSDLPQGIYVGDSIAAATLVAGDVVDAPIIIFGVVVDEDKLVLENSLTLEDVVGAGDVGARTIRDILRTLDIIPRTTRSVTSTENA
jgi:hypothetical protein